MRDAGVSVFVELGPGTGLRVDGPRDRRRRPRRLAVIPALRENTGGTFGRRGAGGAFVAGVEIGWPAFFAPGWVAAGSTCRRIRSRRRGSARRPPPGPARWPTGASWPAGHPAARRGRAAGRRPGRGADRPALRGHPPLDRRPRPRRRRGVPGHRLPGTGRPARPTRSAAGKCRSSPWPSRWCSGRGSGPTSRSWWAPPDRGRPSRPADPLPGPPPPGQHVDPPRHPGVLAPGEIRSGQAPQRSGPRPVRKPWPSTTSTPGWRPAAVYGPVLRRAARAVAAGRRPVRRGWSSAGSPRTRGRLRPPPGAAGRGPAGQPRSSRPNAGKNLMPFSWNGVSLHAAGATPCCGCAGRVTATRSPSRHPTWRATRCFRRVPGPARAHRPDLGRAFPRGTRCCGLHFAPLSPAGGGRGPGPELGGHRPGHLRSAVRCGPLAPPVRRVSSPSPVWCRTGHLVQIAGGDGGAGPSVAHEAAAPRCWACFRTGWRGPSWSRPSWSW